MKIDEIEHTTSEDKDQQTLLAAINRVREPLRFCRRADGAVDVLFDDGAAVPTDYVGTLPPLYPEWLGDRSFAEVHGCRFPYIVGEMARGISTAEMVIAAAEAGLMGFFGSAGLTLQATEQSIQKIQSALGSNAECWGANLIHSPNEVGLEDGFVDLFLRLKVRRISASAFMSLTSAVVRYAVTGLQCDQAGRILRQNYLFAKISRPEIAEKFLSPAPEKMLAELVEKGAISADEAALAAHIPISEDVTVEADSGGHTDNRSLTTLFPTICRVRHEMIDKFGFERNIRLGAAGGIGSPSAAAAAFGLGAAYILTGSINQSSLESGLSEEARGMLAGAGIADVAMAPAADMFERGVKVQVLKRETMFPQRAQKLYEVYRDHEGIDDIPTALRQKLEAEIFGVPLAQVWDNTRQFFLTRDPAEAERGDRDPKHRMALVFRWYLFMASQWAREGVKERRNDYQIWCGPAMGAFNAWTRNSFLEHAENRQVVQIARNMLEGAAVVTRAQQLRSYGVAVPLAAFEFRPRPIGF